MNNLLPIFMKLVDCNCIVVGGGNIALQKIKQLLDSDAKVTVIAPKIISDIKKMNVKLLYRNYTTSDLNKCIMVIAATDDIQVNKLIYNDAKKKGIPVNVVDQPDLCSFYMGSVYEDNDLKIAISTNGKCPSFGLYIKDYIKNMSKGMWGKSLSELAKYRKKIIKSLLNYSEKKEVMGRLVQQKFQSMEKLKTRRGKVFLVGAGPGDPELITVKGLLAIKGADVILHDALIHPHLVFEINSIAKKIFVGKREDKHSISQDVIHEIMIEEASKGMQVVRLKGGDPFIFGRGGEEVMALAKDGIRFEVIPGVTSGLGAASGFGIPVTLRDDSTSTIFITGHQCQTTKTQDWAILAKLNSTLIIYMGVRRIGVISKELIDNGKSKNTPIAIVQNATLKSQKIIVLKLDEVIKKISNYSKLTPAIIIIGEVVNYYSKVKKCIENIPNEFIYPLEDYGFDIWKNKYNKV